MNSDLWLGVSDDFAAEGDWHAFKNFVVFQFLVEERGNTISQWILVMLDVIVALLHRGALQPELDLADQPLLEARHFILLW